MERAAIRTPYQQPSVGPLLTIDTESLRKALFCFEYIMPPIAVLFQPVGYVVDCKVHGLRRLELFPGERHGNRCARHTSWRISNVEGLAAHVHVVVDENLAGALLH